MIKIKNNLKVFRPRIETKFWIKKSVPFIKKSFKGKVKVLDIFTGTGFLGLVVLKEIPHSHVTFVDISKKAILQTKENLKANNFSSKRWKVIKSDLFKEIKGKWHVVLANPPYVAAERKKEVDPETLKNDPKKALFAGPKGLKIIKKFLKQAPKYLEKGGVVLMEFDPNQKKEIKKLAEENFKIHFKKDQFQKTRYVLLKNAKRN